MKPGELARIHGIGRRSGEIAIILGESVWPNLKTYNILLGADYVEGVDSRLFEPLEEDDEGG